MAQTAPGGTAVEAQAVDTGRVLRRTLVSGDLGVPVAAGTTGTGLSADGRTLVLGTIHPVDPGKPVRRTTLVALDTGFHQAPRTFVLRGDFSVDAVSPHARWLYLIQRRGPGIHVFDYAVRAFDLRAGRLVRGAIVDRREPNEKMAGYPIARVETGTGRYAFTLYSGMDGGGFVHALDTATRSARCLDLPASVSQDVIGRLQLRQQGQRLLLAPPGGRVVAWLDLRTQVMHAA